MTGNETEADDFRDEERTEAMEKACLDIMEICHEHTECAIDGPVILHRKMQCLPQKVMPLPGFHPSSH